MLNVFESASAAERLARATEFLAAIPPGTEVAIVGHSREAADDLVRKWSASLPATFGLHRFSLTQIAVRFATPDLTRLGLAPSTALASEAVAARTVFEATQRGDLKHFASVATRPGFAAAVAATIHELRASGVEPKMMESLGSAGPDMAVLLRDFGRQLSAAGLADRSALFQIATEAVTRGEDPLMRAPLLLLDPAIASRAERDFIAALVAGSRQATATVPSGDDRTLEALGKITAALCRAPLKSGTSLERLQNHVFGDLPADSYADDEHVRMFSAPGEGRESVEIARRLLEEARRVVVNGPTIAPGEIFAERSSYGDVALIGRLREALARINPAIPTEAIDEAIRRITHQETASLVENNRRFHQMLVSGIEVEYRREDGSIAGDQVFLIDHNEPGNNDWLAVNQLTVIEDKKNRRADVVVFTNGLPLAVIELKNPGDENATIRGAFNQLQTYKKDIPCLFPYNELLVISDGLDARAGTLTADWERFMPWRTVEGTDLAPKGSLQLDVLVKGIFEKSRFLDLIRNFIVFEAKDKLAKKMAGYHQFHAVNKAVQCTLRASSKDGDKRAGVIWHTQGSGKSLSMVFYAGKLIQHPEMENPTIVVLTDRIDLDGQLFGTFSRCEQVLRQTPVQAENREQLRDLLQVSSGGVVFTTIQKFFPETKSDTYPTLSKRRNIVVIADEAHRSQYDFIDGFARHMRDALPNASFIGFTGTPIEAGDRSTPAVFGDYIDVYDILRAVEDGATVRIYYEGRLAKLELKEEERPKIDPEFEEITEGEEVERKEKLKSKWARLEAMVGTPNRIALVAKDLVEHFERRLDAMDGKGMIVCMSRRICVDLYNAIVKLRPSWHHEDDDKGIIKVVMTGSAADGEDWQPHIRNKARREALAKRFKNADDAMKLVIVRDMWLTGFDAPCLHTMYADKPMRSHGLMQAIARVNRVFKDKPGGLVVDYLGLADQLKRAMADYTEAGGKGDTTLDQEQAVELMRKNFEVVADMLHGFDYSKYLTGTPAERVKVVPNAIEFILEQERQKQDNLKTRYMQSTLALSKAFALAVPNEKALAVRDHVGFFQVVRAGLRKHTEDGTPEEMLDAAVRQIVSRAVASDEVIDIFAAAGLKTPDISILSDEFLAEVRRLPQRNLAMEVLRKLLNDEIKTHARKNLVQSRSFAEMLERTIRKYQNRSIDAAQVIVELVELAKEMREAHKRGEELHLTEEELAFYDALEVNDAAVKIMGDEVLRQIAHELVDIVHRNVTIDWTVKESVRAKLRALVKRLLRKYGYPPDKQEKATLTVLEQAELLCKDWAA